MLYCYLDHTSLYIILRTALTSVRHLTCPIVHVAYYYSSFMCNIIPVWHLAYLLFLRGYLVGRPHTLLNASLSMYTYILFLFCHVCHIFHNKHRFSLYYLCSSHPVFSSSTEREKKSLVTYLRGTHWHY